jgi:hypothetical protein
MPALSSGTARRLAGCVLTADGRPHTYDLTESHETSHERSWIVPDLNDLPSNDPDYLNALRGALVELTPRQQRAVELLATGSTHEAAATAVGVARETITRWSSNHPAFRAALNLHRVATAVDMASRGLRIRALALDVVERNLESADLSAALAVLRVLPALDTQRPADADSLLAADLQRMAAQVPGPPVPRGADGRVNLLASFEPDLLTNNAERASRIALSNLAEAAGLFDDDLTSGEP